MEGEIRNFIAIWITVLASLCYCHTIAKFIHKGTTRFFTFLPIIALFLYLPLNLTTIHLGSTTAFFIAWLANFKLLLFAFGKGPLSSHPPLSSSHFILFSCLPIKVQHHLQASPISSKPQNSKNSPLNHVPKIFLLGILIQLYKYKGFIHPKIIMVLYCLHIYITLELLLVTVAAMVRSAAQIELEPQFDEPYLSTSLQDFWGRRWNLIVSSILRPTVYDPMRSIFSRLIGRKWAPVPAIIATFFVSGLMHELIFYYAGRLRPTLEVTCFFLIHGVCLAAEIVVKKTWNRKFSLPPIVSGPAVIGFVVLTGLCLFIPPILRFDAEGMSRREAAAFVEFVKGVIKVANVGSSGWLGAEAVL